jgi:GTPase
MDSGQVIGIPDEEIMESMMVLFYISTTFKPHAELSIEKVRYGHEGFSFKMRVKSEKVDSERNFVNDLFEIQKKAK